MSQAGPALLPHMAGSIPWIRACRPSPQLAGSFAAVVAGFSVVVAGPGLLAPRRAGGTGHADTFGS